MSTTAIYVALTLPALLDIRTKDSTMGRAGRHDSPGSSSDRHLNTMADKTDNDQKCFNNMPQVSNITMRFYYRGSRRIQCAVA